MRPPARSRWRVVLLAFLASTLPACLIVVSTSPTGVTGGTIVFVAIDDHGLFVASLTVSVADVDGRWRDEGVTAQDGAFRCRVATGVTRVRAGVVAPSGFALAATDRWPRDIDVPATGSVQIEVHVTTAGGSAE